MIRKLVKPVSNVLKLFLKSCDCTELKQLTAMEFFFQYKRSSSEERWKICLCSGIGFMFNPIWKMTAMGAMGKFRIASTSKLAYNILVYLCPKFGAFIKKCTILQLIRRTIRWLKEKLYDFLNEQIIF